MQPKLQIQTNSPKSYYRIEKNLCRTLYAMAEIVYNNQTIDGSPKPLSKRLNRNHDNYYSNLLILLAKQLYERQQAGDSTFGCQLKLSTNSKFLASQIRCDERTIRNYNQRLIKAGIIEKLFHGRSRNYDIIFNEFLVQPIIENADGVQMGNYEHLEHFQDLQQFSMRKNMPTIYTELQLQFNNKLIEKDCENHLQRISNIDDFCRLLSCYRISQHIIYRYKGNTIGEAQPTGEMVKSEPAAATQPKSTQSILRDLRSENTETLRMAYAGIIYSYAIDNIPNWNEDVYEAVHGRVPLYIMNNYLAKLRTPSEFEKYFDNVARPSIDAAATLIKKKITSKKWTKYNVYPDTFFDIKYTKGYWNSIRYCKQNNEKIQKKADETCRLDDLDKLNKILCEYYKAKTTQTDKYFELLQRVRSTIPQRERQFKFCIKNSINKADAYWIVGDKNELIKVS